MSATHGIEPAATRLITEKICTKCKVSKPVNIFSLSRANSDGFQSRCKDCNREYARVNALRISERGRIYRQKNAKRIAEQVQKFNQANPGLKAARMRLYRKKHPDRVAVSAAKSRQKNRAKIAVRVSNYHRKNAPKIAARKREYTKQNWGNISARNRKYAKQNRDKIAAWMRNYTKVRCKNDLQYRLTKNLRGRIFAAIKGKTKSARTLELIGCTIEHLVQHIESQFEPWMSWECYGQSSIPNTRFEIDHIRPCDSFDLSDPEQQRECFNWKNLQPLCSVKNRQKHNRLLR